MSFHATFSTIIFPFTHFHSRESATSALPRKGRRPPSTSSDYGVSRGVDFRDVAAVFNFDFPADLTQYRHRVGRTARAGKEGTAVSFVTAADRKRFLKIVAGKDEKSGKVDEKSGKVAKKGAKKGEKGEKMDEKQEKQEKMDEKQENDKDDSDNESDSSDEEPSPHMLPLKFKMDEVNAFKYRVEDALRAVTKVAVREARLKEIRHELLASDKLKVRMWAGLWEGCRDE